MRNNLLKRIVALAVCVLLTASLGIPSAAASASEVEAQIDSILSYKMKKSGAESVQQLINGELTSGAGNTAEWYILALRQYGKSYDFSAYDAALKKYASANETDNATIRLRYALSFAALGTNYEYITSTLSGSIGKLGVMSWIFALHLINNGYPCAGYSQSAVTDKLLSLQKADGGFALSGDATDVDVTAMAVQALAKRYSDESVKAAVDKALTFLSQRQQANGGFISYGVTNPESCAQVITALSALGIDCEADTRFIKNGSSALDAMLEFRLADGSFCHTAGGAANENSTVQALYSLVALWRSEKGMQSIYTFAKKALPTPTTAKPSAAVVVVKPKGTTKQPISTTLAATTTRVSRRRTTTAAPETTTAFYKATAAPSAVTERITMLLTEEPTAAVTYEETTSAAETTAYGALSAAQTETTALQGTSAPESPTDTASIEKTNYKAIVYAVIAALTLVGFAVLFISGKKDIKNFIAVLLVAAALCGINAFVDIQSKNSFYDKDAALTSADTVSVTLSIRCDSIVGLSDADYIPSNGVILTESEFTVEKNATVYDVLVLAARQNEIQMENSSPADSSAYIAGINYIYEFDFGDVAGWIYKVNGKTPPEGCGTYTVSDGDRIEWLYSLDLGENIQ